ncbi:hypothetical protein EVAR_25584_1 [Eumeta japonica]|uniref:Uncharacterized protein n=1 Tax=Eumeta variegata TaxID=151549 RepID=A0A4C1V1D5_EUMVA|nr:hypothetical protein EVAR_25584_1 [Eumeta japonica]
MGHIVWVCSLKPFTLVRCGSGAVNVIDAVSTSATDGLRRHRNERRGVFPHFLVANDGLRPNSERLNADSASAVGHVVAAPTLAPPTPRPGVQALPGAVVFFLPATKNKRHRVEGAPDTLLGFKPYGDRGRGWRCNQHAPVRNVHGKYFSHRQEVFALVFRPASESSGGPFLFSSLYSPSFGYSIPTQEVGNTLVTSLGFRVSMGGGDS